MSQDNLDTLTALESSLLHNFVKRGKRIVSIPVDFYHADFKLRAIAKFHGLEYVGTYHLRRRIVAYRQRMR